MTAEASQMSPRPSLGSAFVAPWRRVFEPAKAGLSLVGAAPAAFWGTFVVHALLLTATFIGLLLWNDTTSAEYIWKPPPATGPAAVIAATGPYWRLHERSVADVWADWHRHGPIGPAEALVLILPLLVLVCTAFGAWLHLVTIHEGGSVWASYKRAFRVITACLGLLWMLTLVLGSLMILAEHRAVVERVKETFNGSQLWAVATVAVPVGIVLLLGWISAAMRAARVAAVSGESAPHCEGCGYDLTHIPEERRCPECGLDVEPSLSAVGARPGCAWERVQRPAAWARTSLALLFRPEVFYRRLRLRTPERLARCFALWHYAALGAAGATWALAVSLITGERRFEAVVAIPVAFFLWVPLCGWAIQQTVGAIGVSWALARTELGDPRTLRKVVAYEVVFLWLPGLFISAIVVSIIRWSLWISKCVFKTRIYFLLGAPVELTVIWLGCLALLLLWLWRYYVAIRAVRWGNF